MRTILVPKPAQKTKPGAANDEQKINRMRRIRRVNRSDVCRPYGKSNGQRAKEGRGMNWLQIWHRTICGRNQTEYHLPIHLLLSSCNDKTNNISSIGASPEQWTLKDLWGIWSNNTIWKESRIDRQATVAWIIHTRERSMFFGKKWTKHRISHSTGEQHQINKGSQIGRVTNVEVIWPKSHASFFICNGDKPLTWHLSCLVFYFQKPSIRVGLLRNEN